MEDLSIYFTKNYIKSPSIINSNININLENLESIILTILIVQWVSRSCVLLSLLERRVITRMASYCAIVILISIAKGDCRFSYQFER